MRREEIRAATDDIVERYGSLLGWIATVLFLERNRRRVDAPEDDAYDLVIAVATGQMSYQESAARLASWT